MSNDLRPRAVAPLFVVTAALHLAAVFSRLDLIAAHVPEAVAGGLLVAHIPLLFVEGYFESRVEYGTSANLPGWMRIKSWPIKASFTFAFTYLAIVVLQAWDISIGPIDPTPPPEWSDFQRIQWFAIMSVGMFFPNYLAATGLLIPVLRGVARPFHRLPTLLGASILGGLGAAAGVGLFTALSDESLRGGIADVKGTIDSNPALLLGVTLGVILVPIVLGVFIKRDDTLR